ncbi:hypothetical protein [Microbispora sp. H13382]|nr:hypothetical protein [Microbispora sp. H13382]
MRPRPAAEAERLVGCSVGTRHHIGRHHHCWRDVVFLERRSTVTGA